jgi:hypothetical protein
MIEVPEAPESAKRDPRALNAYRHGLTGQVVIMTPADELAYKSHCQGIHKALAPEGALEASLAQSIADDRWRLLRAAAIDNSTFAIRLGGPDQFTAHHEEIDAALAQAVAWASDAKNLNLLTLYEGRIQRRVEKNLQMLKQLEAERKAALQQAVEEAKLLVQLAASKGETYDIESEFPSEALPPQFDFSTRQIARLAAHSQRLAQARLPLRRAA